MRGLEKVELFVKFIRKKPFSFVFFINFTKEKWFLLQSVAVVTS